jgi:hypothetical protein
MDNDYDEFDDWNDGDLFGRPVQRHPFYDFIERNHWKGIVHLLVDDVPYQTACLNEDLEEAKLLISQGAFVDNKHWWSQSSYLCPCGLSSCIDKDYKTHLTFLFNKKNDRFEPDINVPLMRKLVDFGLLDVEDFPVDEIFDVFSNNCNWESEHELCEFLISVVPPTRLASIRRIHVGDKSLVSETLDPSIPSETLLHAIFYGYASEEKDTQYFKSFISMPEMRALAHHKTQHGETALYKSIHHINVELIKILLNIDGWDVNQKSSLREGRTAFMCTLSRFAKVKNPEVWQKVFDIFQILMAHGMDLEITDNMGNSVWSYISHFDWESILGVAKPHIPYVRKPYTKNELKRKAEKLVIHWEQFHQYGKNYERIALSLEQKKKIETTIQLTKPYKYCKDIKIINEIIEKILDMLKYEDKEYISGFKSFLYYRTHWFLQTRKLDDFFRKISEN